MRRYLPLLGLASALFAAAPAQTPAIYDFNMPDVHGKLAPLAQYKKQVLLIVNVATGSSYTPQLAQLQALYERYHSAGLDILAFPSNDFGAEEPNSDEAIDSFCKSNYHTTFPIFSKVAVRGDEVTPLFHYLAKEANPKLKGDVHWNFTKFLVGRNGKLVARFEPDTAPDDPDVLVAIEKALADSGASSQERPNPPQENEDQTPPRSDE